jgi:beta-glucosidase
MKLLNLFAFLLIASISARADLTAVTVSPTMLHAPSGTPALGFTGKVTYTLAPLTNDSVFVTLSIVPSAGGAALALTSVTGDVGVVNVNTNLPNAAQTFSIFFEAAAPQAGVQYIARIVANAVTSNMQTDLTAKLNALSKAQKGTLCGGDGGFEGSGAGAIPEIYMSDGPHGVRPPNGGNATCFPTCAGEACTWDTSIAFIQGQAKGEEFRSYGFNCELGPAMDLVYHPQGGRASEYYSEDPYLSGNMAAADVRGVQTRGVIATIKHYACNNIELDRGSGENAVMSERSLREIYLYNWEPPITQSHCNGIMGAYNKVLGIQACESQYLQTTILRNTWAYRSLVMTDWGAAFNQANAAQYGMDIQMPNGGAYQGTIGVSTDAIANMHASRILYAHEMIGDMNAGYNKTAYPRIQGNTPYPAHDSIARIVGTAGIVLARNVGNILPIPKTGKAIAITGPFATQFRAGPGGSSYVTAWKSVTPQQGINNLLNALPAGHSTITTDLNAADYIVVFVGVEGEQEGSDRPYLAVTDHSSKYPSSFNGGDEDAAAALAATNGQAKTIVVFTGGSAASAGNWSKANAIVMAFYPGQEQGAAIADILFGNANPSGKLPVTFPVDATQLPNFTLTSSLNLVYPAADTAHGYFRVNKNKWTPLFAFGHGLSYTTFTYSALQIYPTTISAGDNVHVHMTVTNSGSVAGKEVVELYLSMPSGGAVPVRVQNLRGFQKVSLAPGASTPVDFVLSQRDMQVFNPNGADFNANGAFQVLTGAYGVRVGTSSDQAEQPTVSSTFSVQ